MPKLPIIVFIETNREDINFFFKRVIEVKLSIDLRVLERPENDDQKEVLVEKIRGIRPKGIICAEDDFFVYIDQKLCELLKNNPETSASKILLLFDGMIVYDLGPPPKCNADFGLRLPASSEDIVNAILKLLE